MLAFLRGTARALARPMPRSLSLGALALFALLLGACATTRGQAKELGAFTLACPVSNVTIESYPGAQYVVEGCGHRVEVDCQDPGTVDRSDHPDGHSFCQARKPR